MILNLEQNELVDWFRVFADLERQGYSVRRVSVEIDIAHSTLWGWKNGSQAKLEDAMKLLALWMKITRKSVDAIPTHNRYAVAMPLNVRESDQNPNQ